MDKKEALEFKLDFIDKEIEYHKSELQRYEKIRQETLEQLEKTLDYTIFLQ